MDHGDKLALDELQVFRKDVGTFIRQYDFLSQIVNYEDPSLEKLSIYLRHLALVISTEQLNLVPPDELRTSVTIRVPWLHKPPLQPSELRWP
ncbi:MAG TPA: hypothetical protein VGH31_08515, partial [Acidimicrobiales bacterium]